MSIHATWEIERAEAVFSPLILILPMEVEPRWLARIENSGKNSNRGNSDFRGEWYFNPVTSWEKYRGEEWRGWRRNYEGEFRPELLISILRYITLNHGHKSLSRLALSLSLSLWLTPDLPWLNHGKPYIIGKQRTYGVHRGDAWLFVCVMPAFMGCIKRGGRFVTSRGHPRNIYPGNSFPDISPLRILSTDQLVGWPRFNLGTRNIKRLFISSTSFYGPFCIYELKCPWGFALSVCIHYSIFFDSLSILFPFHCIVWKRNAVVC